MKKIIRSAWDEEEMSEEEFYSEKARTHLVEDGEIDSWEAAFMDGYDQAG